MNCLLKVTFTGASWGCIAKQDEDSRRFLWPLTLTGVRQGSEAVAVRMTPAYFAARVTPADNADLITGLRAGDQIVSWSRTMSGATDYKNVVGVTESTVRSACYVDKETQQMLCQGGPCCMRVRLVPRCTTPRCPGSIVESVVCTFI